MMGWRSSLCTACIILLAAPAGFAGIYDGPPGGGFYSDLYLQGWQHGCETGVASSADNVYEYRRQFRQDWQLAQNDTYHKGWRDAYDYCRKHILRGN